VIHDPANPIAAPTVTGLLQASAMMAAPDVLMQQGLAQLETFGEALTPKQREAVDAILPALRGEQSFESLERQFAGDAGDADTDADTDTDAVAGADTDATAGGGGFTGLVKVETIEARTEDDGADSGPSQSSMIAYYAAGVGVMFLLFSMAGAGGSLLEEEENGTLERVLTSRVSMRTLLLGNWLFFAIVGATQVVIMFLWAWLIFGLDLFTPNHLAGFAAMTLVTAAAAAAFGIVLATVCKSRAQLSGMSTIIILIMSALGGSMMPKFVAEDLFAITSPFTFNGWALDGYLKVFWYDDPAHGLLASVAYLWPQLLVLTGLTVVFLLVARLLARRWEVA
jgi:ABC-2 type transport system permease protein